MILVTGATGSIGKHLVRELRQRGVAFRALVRDAAKAATLDCDCVVGDFDDPVALAAALDGVDQVFLNSAGAQPVTGPQPMIRQQRNAIDAAVKAGVRRIVKVSVWRARPGGKLAEGAHWEIEEHLTASGVDWSILQPSGFMENFRTGQGAFTDDGHLIGAYGAGRMSYIASADIAACAAVVLADETFGTAQRFVLTGPEALDHDQIAAALSAAHNRPVGYVDLPPAEFAARLTAQGLPAQFAADVAELCNQVARDYYAETTTAVSDLTGNTPRSFADYLTTEPWR
ncbi:NAD(P)H-binding protein [Nocardia vinacea]|uniref:NAD(P)H-binding protein n=1 Tax=Nocardia vinacea TaxID=96468 RepID=UPI00342178B1